MKGIWNVRAIKEDPLFNVDVLSAETDEKEMSLELPRGLVDLSDWRSLEVTVSRDEGDGDIVMKGVVYKCDEGRLEVSIHGLWLRMATDDCDEFSEGDEVYIVVRRID